MDDALPDAYAQHSLNILRVAAGHRAKAMEVLLDLEGTLIAKVATAKTLNNAARLGALLEQTQGTISKAYSVIEKEHVRDLRGLAKVEAKATAKIMGGAIGADVFGVAVTANQLEKIADGSSIMGNSSGEWWKKQDSDLQHKFRGTMQQGILLGETNDELIKRVRGTRAGAFKDGVMEGSRREAAALVRSSAISTANAARLKTLEQMDDVVKGIQWVSTLDGRTTKICMGLSGLMWRLPDYAPIGHDKAFPGPTAHWNCRSTQIPVLRSWEELTGKKLKSLDDEELEQRVKEKLAAMDMDPAQIAQAKIRTRASMDGQVSENISFDDWLAKKSDPFINSQLGPGRAKLWNRGKGPISLSDLTDQTNRPLTLKQLDDFISNGSPLPETQGVDFFALDPDALAALKADSDPALAAIAAVAESAATAAAEAAAAVLALDTAAQEAIDKMLAGETTKLEKQYAAEAMAAGKPKTAGTLAEIKAAAAAKQAANTQSAAISGAKQKFLEGKDFTPAQLKALDGLDPAIKQGYLDTWAELKTLKDAADATTALQATALGKIDELAEAVAASNVSPDQIKLIMALPSDMQKELSVKAGQIQAVKTAVSTLDTAPDFVFDSMADGTPWDDMTAAAALLPDDHPSKISFLAKLKTAQNIKDSEKLLTDESALAFLLDPKGDDGFWAGEALKTLPDDNPLKVEFLKTVEIKKSNLADEYAAVLASGNPAGITPQLDTFWQTLGPDAKDAIIDAAEAQAQLAKAQAAVAATNATKPKRVRKTKAAPKTLAEAGSPPELLPVLPVQPMIPDDFPADPAALKVVKRLGGSTGAQLVEGPDGRQYVRKGGASADHVRSEFAADRLYAALGVDVPRGALYDAAGPNPVKLTEYLPGKEFSALTGADKAKAIAQLQKGFAIDALMGNWDVVGMSGDNVLFSGGKVFRIDNGGALAFRAQGGLKAAEDWNEFPTELHSMRESAQGQPIFGGMDIYSISDQILAIPEGAIDSAGLDVTTAATVKARLAQLKHVAERGKRFQRDAFKPEAFDTHARQTLVIRKAGIDQNLLAATSRSGVMLTDPKTGRSFGNLRAIASASNSATAADPFYHKVKAAYVTVNAHFAKGDGANGSSIQAALDLKATLTTLAKTPGPQQSMANAYLQALGPLESELKLAKAGKKPSGLLPHVHQVAPTGPPAPAPTGQSVVQALHAELLKQLTAKGVPAGQAKTAIMGYLDWTNSQAGNSWQPKPRGAKYWLWKQRAVNQNANFWGGQNGKGTINEARDEYLKLVQAAGSEETVDLVFSAHHALMQEQLALVDVDYNDRDGKALLLMRSEDAALYPGKKAGQTASLSRGATESHSIFNPVYVKAGSNAFLTVQAVPHSRVLWSYWFEDGPGSGASGFIGDGENEFGADSSDIPLKLFGRTGTHPIQASRTVAEWKAQGIPTDHL